MIYRPRNDYVLIRTTQAGISKTGLAFPDISLQGKEHIVHAVGPAVEGLKVGEKVLMVGKMGEDYAYLPNSKDLFIIKQANIVLVYEVEEDG